MGWTVRDNICLQTSVNCVWEDSCEEVPEEVNKLSNKCDFENFGNEQGKSLITCRSAGPGLTLESGADFCLLNKQSE